jgi:hypothetical protein
MSDETGIVIRYIVTPLHRIDDLTLQRFNDLTWRSHSSFAIRHFAHVSSC